MNTSIEAYHNGKWEKLKEKLRAELWLWVLGNTPVDHNKQSVNKSKQLWDKFITKITELGDFRGKKKLFASIRSALLKAHQQSVIAIVDKVPSVSILI